MLAGVLLAGCSADNEQGLTGRAPIRLGYSVVTATEQTRAATNLNEDVLTSGTVAVSVKKHADATYPTAKNYTAGTGGVLTAADGFFYETDGSSSDIIAYTPTSFTGVATDQTSDDSYKASDLMWAQRLNQLPTNNTVNLQFKHLMAKIIVNATAGDGISSITSVTLNNVKNGVTFTSADGTATATGSTTNITMSNQGATVIPPQTITGSFITIVTPEGDAVYAVESKDFEAGHQYTLNITVNAAALTATNTLEGWTSEGTVNVQPTVTETRYVVTPVGAIPGLFTINADGDQVFFSKGNLQYDGTNWKFATNQYDVLGANGTKADGTATGHPMDLFTWGNTSSSTEWGGDSYYTANADLSGTYDWGSNAISNGGNTANSGWRTLSKDEWVYLFGTDSSNKRTTTSGLYFAKATVNGVSGVILLPDDWSASNYSLNSTNSTDAAFTTNTISESDWSSNFEAHGCVFLPAAGYRDGTSVGLVGSEGGYWSSTANDSNAYFEHFYSGGVVPASNYGRSLGFSVRLVRRTWYKEVSSATSSDIGKIICSNGHIHTNVSDVACGGSASAIIAYVGSVPGYFDSFIAIALEDAHTTYTTYSNAQLKVGTYASNHAITIGGTTYNSNTGSSGSACYDIVTNSTSTASRIKNSGTVKGWRIPTVTDWRYIFDGLGNGTPSATSPVGVGAGTTYGTGSTLRSSINTACGNTQLQSGLYWSSSELSDNSSHAWYYHFNYSYFFDVTKTYNGYVRAVFAY